MMQTATLTDHRTDSADRCLCSNSKPERHIYHEIFFTEAQSMRDHLTRVFPELLIKELSF